MARGKVPSHKVPGRPHRMILNLSSLSRRKNIPEENNKKLLRNRSKVREGSITVFVKCDNEGQKLFFNIIILALFFDFLLRFSTKNDSSGRKQLKSSGSFVAVGKLR